MPRRLAKNIHPLLTPPTELKGRFLHITDFHPDTHYKTGATFDSGCHRLPGEKAKSSHGSGGKGKSKSRLEDFDGQLNATDKDDDDVSDERLDRGAVAQRATLLTPHRTRTLRASGATFWRT